jgi:hypothetical protein
VSRAGVSMPEGLQVCDAGMLHQRMLAMCTQGHDDRSGLLASVNAWARVCLSGGFGHRPGLACVVCLEARARWFILYEAC